MLPYRICALAVIGNMVGIKMPGIVLIRRDFYIPWACVKHVTFQIITR